MKRLSILLALIGILHIGLIAQTKAELQAQRDKLVQEMELTNRLLSDAQKARKSTSAELALLKEQIKLREQIIGSIRNEMGLLERDIASNEKEIRIQTEKLERLKDEYAQLIYSAYKNSNQEDKLLYIFASEDFYQAWKRLRHLKDLARFREGQADIIEETKAELDEKNEDLRAQRAEKAELLEDQRKEQSRLDASKRETEATLAELQQDEKGLKAKLKKQQDEQRRLSKAIERIIAEEIRRSKKENKGTYALSPEEELNSQYFAKNKGKLPWPVERGLITGRFGSQPHPILPGITIENNGIDISTESASLARSIFEGEISGVIEIPGAGLAVMVKHGAYRTVYSNLKEALVTKGQRVDTKQSLGVLMTDEGASVSHLEIWQVTGDGMKKLDPASWIAR